MPYTLAMAASSLPGRVRRSLFTAWTPQPDGPRWAPWAWTIALSSLVAVLLTAFVPRTGGFASSFVISQAIGLSTHALFAGLGRTLGIDMFELPVAMRTVYVVSVVLAGSWLGYTAAMWVMLGDWDRLLAHMTHASRFLLVIPVVWALITLALFAAVNRLRGQQLARERERGARVRAEREAIAARLQLLNAQIEPHFLYNTLANVSALVAADAAVAQRLLDALIRYLRASSANMSRPLVSLADEMCSVQGYLDVMQMRIGDRLRVRYEVPPEAMAVQLPPAALQTLVENAVKHGIEPSARGGEIVVSARRDASGWSVQVADSGAGLSQGGVSLARGGTGTGLANLAERMRLALGPGAGVALQAGGAGGSLACLRVPMAPDPVTAPAARPGVAHARGATAADN